MSQEESDKVTRANRQLGRVLKGKWTLDELLGLGGMAAVFAATHRNGNRVAIKMLEPEAAQVQDLRSRFQREGYVANKVGHDGAVTIQDDDVDENGIPFLVMELLDGETLDVRLARDGTIPWREALLIAEQTLDVLAAAHAQGVIHRDLKPGNIFLEKTGTIKILDFGIARLGQRTLDKSHTGHDTALGTPGFMPPEQARGRWDEVDARSDLFAVGATLFAVLAGRHVHEAETGNEQFMLAMSAQAPSLAECTKGTPEEVVALVDRALCYDKHERWPDARAMQDAVREAYEALCHEPIASARISVAQDRRTAKIRSEAPTMADPSGEHLRGTTTRPVSDAAIPRTSKRSRWVLPAVLLAGAGAAGWVMVGGRAEVRRTPVSSSEPVVTAPGQPQETAKLEPKPEAPPAPAPSASVALDETDAAAAPPAETAKLPVKTVRPSAKPTKKAEPKPDPTVDIFTKRK